METLHSHCAGLDIHQKEIVVCTYIGSSDEELIKEIRTFPTMTKNLYEMLQWLEELNITHLAMESTGDLLETGFQHSRRLFRNYPRKCTTN